MIRLTEDLLIREEDVISVWMVNTEAPWPRRVTIWYSNSEGNKRYETISLNATQWGELTEKLETMDLRP